MTQESVTTVPSMDLSVVGLGKLGAPLAAVLADAGHSVIGVDVSATAVEALSAGRAPVDEPGLQAMIDRNAPRLSATTDYGQAVAASEVTFLIVPTPSDADGTFSLRYVLAAMEEIGRAVAAKQQRHLVVITSTVMPGATNGPIRQALEAAAGRPLSPTLGLCYSPEFIALGSVISDMLHPDFILVGESEPWAGQLLAELMLGAVEGQPPVMCMNLVNAELAKLAVNTYVTTKISYANMLSEICDRLPGADVGDVTRAIGLDSRIGSRYLQGATPYGGPCFPRDNVAFARLARTLGAKADLAEATDRVNRRQLERLADLALEHLGPGGRIAILGLSYKPGTGVVEESTGVGLAELLSRRGYTPVVYDPAGLAGARLVLGEGAEYTASAAACVARADVVVVTTAWPEFKELPSLLVTAGGRRPTVIDCWRALDPTALAEAADVVYLGTGP